MRSQVNATVASAQKDAEEISAARIADALGRERVERTKEEGARTELRAKRAALESDVAGSTADEQTVERTRATERGVLLGDAKRDREEGRACIPYHYKTFIFRKWHAMFFTCAYLTMAMNNWS